MSRRPNLGLVQRFLNRHSPTRRIATCGSCRTVIRADDDHVIYRRMYVHRECLTAARKP